MKYLSALLALFICAGTAFSQQTGKFEIELDHLGTKRTVSLYVPQDYDANTPYSLMVMLHGSKGDPRELTQVISDNVSASKILNSYIYLAPDGGDDEVKNFHVPAEDITIVDKCIEYAKQNYSIDTNRIFLEGFSLGGRSALAYGLEYPEKFYALILNTPAFQGPKDAMQIYEEVEGLPRINYTNANKIPMIVNNGEDDLYYIKSVAIGVDSLYANKGRVYHQVTQDMGHTINLSSFVAAYVSFDEGQFGDNDARIISVDAIENTTDKNPEVNIKFYSRGDISATKVKFEVTINEETKQYTWEGTSEKFVAVDFTTNEFDLQPGENEINISIVEVNDEVLTQATDVKSCYIYYSNPVRTLPYSCDFSGEDWYKDIYVNQSPSLQNLGYMDDGTNEYMIRYTNPTLMFFNYLGFRDELYLPFFDLTSVANPMLSFDVAYNYFLYNNEIAYADTLVVSISTDGGNSFEEIYKKTADELATFEEPFKDIQDQNFIYSVTPSENNWRTEEIDLSAFKDATKAQIRFEIIDAWGGITMLDNLKLDTKTSVEDGYSNSDITIYPNPTADYITVDTDLIKSYKVIDMLGNDLTSEVQAEGKTLNVSSLVSGAYTLMINGKAHNFVVSK